MKVQQIKNEGKKEKNEPCHLFGYGTPKIPSDSRIFPFSLRPTKHSGTVCSPKKEQIAFLVLESQELIAKVSPSESEDLFISC